MDEKNKDNKLEITLTVNRGKNLRPVYDAHIFGFRKLTKCLECESIGSYEDQHPVEPCRDCGGEILERDENDNRIVGKWDHEQDVWLLKKT